ncbi:hypothetical protein JW756_06490 [Candidatus Woesearchaeota archaeon]|nr:hypothetical protein [Candidatus Woesearchaeota archaeon]
MSLSNILSKITEYLEIPSVIRFEQPFMHYLAEDFTMPGYDVEMHDRILIVKKKNSASPKIVTAHIDRHGVVVNQEGQFEYAAFNAKMNYGDEPESSESLIKKSGERFVNEAVYAYDLEGKTIAEGVVKSFSCGAGKGHLFFQIEGLKGLPAGTPVAYKSILANQNGSISSQIDNAISVAVIHQLLKDGFDGKVLFATEEEIGRSWQHIVNYLSTLEMKSQKMVTLDTTPYENQDAINKGLIVLRNKDERGVFNPDLVSCLRSICEEQKISYEMKDESIELQNAKLAAGLKPKKLGTTELGRIVQHTNGDFNGATIQIPTINYHTNHETTSELALNNYYEALKRIL